MVHTLVRCDRYGVLRVPGSHQSRGGRIDEGQLVYAEARAVEALTERFLKRARDDSGVLA